MGRGINNARLPHCLPRLTMRRESPMDRSAEASNVAPFVRAA